MFTTPARRQQFGAKSFAAVLLSLFLLLAWPLWQRFASPTAAFAQTAHEKIYVRDRQYAAEITARGGKLIADYGAFQVLAVPQSLAETLTQQAAVDVRAEENQILLKAGALDTTRPEIQALRQQSSPKIRLHLVHFAAPIKPEWHAELLATGVQIVNYLPHNAYLVSGEVDSLENLQQWAAQSQVVQWEGVYEARFKLAPNITNAPAPAEALYGIQLLTRPDDNQTTLALINRLRLAPVNHQFRVAKFLNLIVALPPSALGVLAERDDVISLARYQVPRRFDERQNQLVAGNLNGVQPATGDYLNWLAIQGFTQAQFNASNFTVNITDTGIDNGTTTPTHFGLYRAGDRANASRITYSRLVGTPSGAESTIKGCDGHGTLNAHIVAGFVPTGAPFNAFPHADASGFRFGLGIAPFVKVGASVIFDNGGGLFGDYTFPDFIELESRAYQDGARISSNSWGSNATGDYNIDAQAYDYLTRDAQPDGAAATAPGNQEMVLIFAAGNDGPLAQSVGAPGTGKNVLTVGASESVHAFGGPDKCTTTDGEADSAHDMTTFSSRGPTADGRHKPDLVAPGTHITGGVVQIANPPANGQADACFNAAGVCGGPSTSRNFFPPGQQFYTASTGTSHSTPAVAGAAALLRQRFLNDGLPVPSPAMTKAVLMNSARYLTGANANDALWSHAQGLGAIHLQTTLGMFSTPTLFRDQEAIDLFTATGQVRTINGTIHDPGKPLRITLAWTDAPGSTASAAWVNNLDLEVTVGGQTYRGNVFGGALSTTGGAFDTKNNVESILLPAGLSGAFTIRIIAANIAGDGVPNNATTLDQDFALVVFNMTEAVQPLIGAASGSLANETCAPANNAIDPGEQVTVNLSLQNIGRAPTTNLVATLLASGGVTQPGAAQNFGAVPAHSTAVSRPFTFRAAGVCGGSITAMLQLQDGATNLGTVSYQFKLGATATVTSTLTNTTNISIPLSGPAAVYPSSVSVSGLSGVISRVSVTLTNLNHTNPDDLDIMLIAPSGQKVLLMSDCGGGGDLVNTTLTFSDGATALPNTAQITTGTYSPTNFGIGDSFAQPAPPGQPPDPQQMSVFNGGTPNGTWSLYLVDDLTSNAGSLAGGWSLTITTEEPLCCASIPCSLTLAPATIASGAVGTPYSQPFTTTGGSGAVTFSLTGALPNGISFNNGVLAGTPTQGGNFPISITATDAQGCVSGNSFTLAIACPSLSLQPVALPDGTIGTAYNQMLSALPAGGNYSFAVSSGALPAGVTLNNATGALTGTPTALGSYNFSITATGFGNCTVTQNYQVVIACPTATISPATLPSATINLSYNQSFTVTGLSGTPTFGLSGALPAGVSLTSGGVLSGLPTQGGVFNFIITAMNSNGCAAMREYNLTVNSPLGITTASLPSARRNVVYSQTLSASGGAQPYTWSLASGGLPAGVSLQPDGVLSGTPTALGAFNLVVQVTDANLLVTQRPLTLQVRAHSTSADFDGDGRTDFSVWRGWQSEWRVLRSATGTTQTTLWGASYAPYNDIPVPGDYDGDGKTDIAVWRPAGGGWFIIRSADGSQFTQFHGQPGDTPVPGDYDGDGKTDLAVWRGNTTQWLILQSGNGTLRQVNWGASFAPYFDVPVPGDYDGDGKTDIAVWRGNATQWFILRSSDNTTQQTSWGAGYAPYFDVPVPGDYDGDGKTDLAVWRGNATRWFIRRSSDGATSEIIWGASFAPYFDIPVPGDYDGDGKTDVAVWRPGAGTWFVLRSQDSGILVQPHGQNGDTPLPGAPR